MAPTPLKLSSQPAPNDKPEVPCAATHLPHCILRLRNADAHHQKETRCHRWASRTPCHWGNAEGRRNVTNTVMFRGKYFGTRGLRSAGPRMPVLFPLVFIAMHEHRLMTQSVWAHTNFNAQRFELILQHLDVKRSNSIRKNKIRTGFDLAETFEPGRKKSLRVKKR